MHSIASMSTLAAADGPALPLITTLAATLTAAWLLGLLTQRLRLSPIVGYLIAGVLVGPHTPGFIANTEIAHELSEIGVILLMFGVGLHFHLADLLKVQRVAIPGAIGQSIVATLLGCVVAIAFGMAFKTGIVLGIALSVASTVVLIRVLTDNRLLDTQHGHVAVGWLIVEDILTVVVLVLIPAMGARPGGDSSQSIWIALPLALLKLSAFVAIMLVVGAKLIPRLMVVVARFRSRELFTLTVLVMAIAIATGAYYAFGASMALGAFMAGMVVGQSSVSQQAGADLLPLRDAFAVLFFASVGMLLDPMFVVHHPLLLLAALGVVLVGKPLAAMLIVGIIGYPLRTALVVALGLAQIGEFSFIVASLGKSFDLLDIENRTQNAVVATAIVSITVNPLLMRALPSIERAIARWPAVHKWLNRGEKGGITNAAAEEALSADAGPLAVVLGYGPVGRTVDGLLRERSVKTIVVEQNMNTVEELTRAGRAAIYGDAFNIEVLAQAVSKATHLIITLPHSANRNPLISAAKLLNPELNVIVRSRYMKESEELRQVGADHVRYEEIEIAVALSRLVLREQGEHPETIDREVSRVREELRIATA